MAQITITINNREYSIACEDGQEGRILQLSRILDEKAKMFVEAMGQINENMLLTMVGLVLADELFEMKKSGQTAPLDSTKILDFDKTISANLNKLESEIKAIANKVEML